MQLHGCVRSWLSDRSFMVNPWSYFFFKLVLHDWYNKGHGMCYPVCGMEYIKSFAISVVLYPMSDPI